MGTPVLIAHTSRDGRWHYVECRIARRSGCRPDLAPVSAEFKQMVANSTFAAFIRDKVNLATPMGSVVANIGTILPMRSNSGYGGATAGAGQTIES